MILSSKTMEVVALTQEGQSVTPEGKSPCTCTMEQKFQHHYSYTCEDVTNSGCTESLPMREQCQALPTLYGHCSRLEFQFLQYINTPKDHWVVCIGVPYRIAYWQVDDSKEQNGSFNIAITQAKQDLLEKKDTLGLYD